MLLFIIRRLGVMLLTAFALTFIVFYLTNLPPNLEKFPALFHKYLLFHQSPALLIL